MRQNKMRRPLRLRPRKTVYAYNLTHGLSKSCGAAQHKKVNHTGKMLVDITGVKYGRLTAVSYVKGDQWLFRCECGTERVMRASSVKRGEIKSCGCLDTKVLSAEDIERRNRSIIGGIVNGKLRTTNSSGVTGVQIINRKAMQFYKARITVNGKDISLGVYPTLEEAAAARKRAEEQYFIPRLK